MITEMTQCVLSGVSGLDSEFGEIIVIGTCSVAKTIEQCPLEAEPASGVVTEVVRCEDGELSGWWSTDETQTVGEEKLLERRKRSRG